MNVIKQLNVKFIGIIALLAAIAPSTSQAFTLIYSTSAKLASSGWQTSGLTIDYDWSACSSVSTSTLNAALSDAVNAWNHLPSTSLTLSIGSSTSTSYSSLAAKAATPSVSNNIVIFCDASIYADFSITSVSGATLEWFDGGGKNYLAFIGLNSTGDANDISNYTETTLSILMAHEIGHSLGLGHSPDTDALMYYRTAKTQLNFSQDDIDGATYLYPRSEPGSGGFLGCGSLALLDKGSKKSDPSDGVPEFSALFAIVVLSWIILRSRQHAATNTL